MSGSQTSVGPATHTTAGSETRPRSHRSGTSGAYPALNISAPMNGQHSVATHIPPSNPSKYIRQCLPLLREESRKVNDANAGKKNLGVRHNSYGPRFNPEMPTRLCSSPIATCAAMASRELRSARVLLLVASEKNNASAIRASRIRQNRLPILLRQRKALLCVGLLFFLYPNFADL